MGMLIDGAWAEDADSRMRNGAFVREPSALPSRLGPDVQDLLRREPERFVLVASASCPWSHGVVIASVLKGFGDVIPVHWAGGPRVEGYGLLPNGPLSGTVTHLHQLYSMTDPTYSGRATVPVLWDRVEARVLSNSSADLINIFDTAGNAPLLCPTAHQADIDALTARIFDGLSNAVYRAGLAERQDAYDAAVDSVFTTLDELEDRLSHQSFLMGDWLSTADIRLFATLVRFDTVYATHFRCSRKRLVDYPNLWAFTRAFYQRDGIRETVDFKAIRFGYYVNDGSHNPHNIIGAQPDIDWDAPV